MASNFGEDDNHELRGVNEFDDPTNPHVTIGDSNANTEQTFHSVTLSCPANALGLLDQYLAVEIEEDACDWRARPEIPTKNEILDRPESWQRPSAEVVIHGIRPQGAFDSKDHYLSIHYELLREEAVRPLRESIPFVQKLINRNDLIEKAGRFHQLGIYCDVYVTGFTFTGRGIGVEVSFSTKCSEKRIFWELSSRLRTGTLVALSADGFNEHCIIAVIAARDMEKLRDNPPRIDLWFANVDDIELDPTKKYLMIEHRAGFFEAQRHTLRALQRLHNETFPLSTITVDCDASEMLNRPPHIADSPLSDLSDVFGEGFESHSLLDDLPKSGSTTLDESQLDALQHMHTKPLSIVQGPPGTGKTYVSVQALRILLKRVKIGIDPPIIVACHTNHALDQLLRHVAAFEPDFARLGGRSKDTGVIKDRTMHTLRGRLTKGREDPRGRRRRARLMKTNLIEQVGELLLPLSEGGFKLHHFKTVDLLSEEQCKSISDGDPEWEVPPVEGKEDPIFQWLGKAVQAAPGPREGEDYGFVTEDEEDEFEMEAIQEREAEAAGLEADWDTLRGPYTTYVPIAQQWAGKQRAPISEDEARRLLKNSNMWQIPPRRRGALLNYLVGEMHQVLQTAFRQVAQVYNTQVVAEIQAASLERDVGILQRQKLIGMTTTGLSKHRALVYAMNPKVIMIEEAAEALEAPVIVGCVPTVEHLILVGDHQQLKPSVVVRAFQGDPWFLDMSLFERMVKNEMDFAILRTQRRMIPEIRQNLLPIYGAKIEDHISVKNRPNVSGMHHNSWIWNHDHPDNKDETMSSWNPMEAEMIVGFYLHLLQNGFRTEQITVLTFYNAQRKEIYRQLRRRLNYEANDPAAAFHPDLASLSNLKIATVDSYQGEENDIVILSLVRSQMSSSIGFAGLDNRICVAISRARNGFYMFGNMALFSLHSQTWLAIHSLMDQAGRVGDQELPVWCEKHGVSTLITKPTDWEMINGGCKEDCNENLPCGHPCKAKCHPFGHKVIECQEKCERRMDCGHSCRLKCGKKCKCDKCPPGNHVSEAWNVVARSSTTRSHSKDPTVVHRTVSHHLGVPQRSSKSSATKGAENDGRSSRGPEKLIDF